jgi:hypothetical protein
VQFPASAAAAVLSALFCYCLLPGTPLPGPAVFVRPKKAAAIEKISYLDFQMIWIIDLLNDVIDCLVFTLEFLLLILLPIRVVLPDTIDLEIFSDYNMSGACIA